MGQLITATEMGHGRKKRRADEFQQLRLGHQQMADEADILRKSTAWQRGKGAKKGPKKCPNLLQRMVGNIFFVRILPVKYKSNKKMVVHIPGYFISYRRMLSSA